MIDGESESLELLPVVAVALVDARQRVLLARRPNGGSHGGLWEFPGGKIELGERPETALAREAREELGIGLDPTDLVPAGFASTPLGTRHLLLLLYRADRWTGEPAPIEASELRWIAPAAMAALPMPPADRALVAMLMREMEARPGIEPGCKDLQSSA